MTDVGLLNCCATVIPCVLCSSVLLSISTHKGIYAQRSSERELCSQFIAFATSLDSTVDLGYVAC